MLSHNNVCVSSMSVVISGSCRPEERFLHAMPMFHLADFSAMTSLFISGGTHIVLPSFVPQRVLEVIAAESVSEVLLAPTMIKMLLDCRDKDTQVADCDLSSLQTIGYGASPITPALLVRARKAFPCAGFRQGYGMTELAPVATLLSREYHNDEHYLSGKMHSAGLPAACTEVRIVDTEDREVPRGTVGEIVVRGANVMLGYWNKPQATADTLRNGWMHTGDGGYMDDDGFVYVCDRLKDMIVSGGENIYSAEVETAIASHPAVGQVAVIGIPCEKWGETVHAVIICKPGATVSDEEVVAYCRQRIAGYKCPRSVEFRESLPLSSVGKVLKTDLRQPFWAGRKSGVA
ncbi:Long-chain-fatty-acid--CoA ligase [compost metagenome]